ncbi:DUF1461 domain-containing protein [archaeon]|jgi:integral membrane protein (TIGR01906 family)|nr:DUF1461 domain-containing protein [archaeon]MBT4351761.1 DUF1461 domain-containing protein [archaeon]MBT4647867.1 DUF1461 domain-containing protein [archaeon]MBT6821067.1 DUF1461 domain-containing protein [archaeon]MBT7392014.1 DUF1461 domain-containing protein [archaeon]
MKNKKRQYFIILSVIILILSLVLGIILTNIENLELYEKSYDKYVVYNKFETGFAKMKVKSIFDYFHSKGELDSGFFNESEISHLKDVKILLLKIKFLFLINLIVLIYIIFILLKKKEFKLLFPSIMIISGSFIFLIFVLLILFNSIIGFEFIFDKFHRAFFVDNWLFDVRTSNMINLFPQGYFSDMAFFIIFRIFLISTILIILGLIIGNMKNKKNLF